MLLMIFSLQHLFFYFFSDHHFTPISFRFAYENENQGIKVTYDQLY